MKLDDLKRRVDELIQLSIKVANNPHPEDRGYYSNELFQEFRSASLSFLRSSFGEEHTFSQDFNKKVIHATLKPIEEGRGILRAAKQEIEGGWLYRLRGLVRAEVFSDFLEMAAHLLDEGYKDAAAVIIGGVLEDTLRKLAVQNNIKTTNDKEKLLTIEPLNIELTKANVYSPLIKGQITTWSIVRNNAAHGDYEKYEANDVKQMLQFVQPFVTEYMR